MDFFELMSITHEGMDILDPSNPEKIRKVGEMLGLTTGSRVIDYGSGNGESLVLWAENFGISGTGIDLSQRFCEQAVRKITDRGLNERLEIICGNGKDYTPEKPGFDAAVCIGATFIWGGYRSAIQAMKKVVRPGGKLAVGEIHWLKDNVPAGYTGAPEDTLNEYGLLRVTREEGCEIEYIVRSSQDDWDWYNTTRWHNMVRWLEANPGHPDRRQVTDYLHQNQENYLRYEREYLGWAVYILSPASA